MAFGGLSLSSFIEQSFQKLYNFVSISDLNTKSFISVL